MTNEMVERLTGSLWMVTKPGGDANCLGRVYRDKAVAIRHRDFDEAVVELRLAGTHEPSEQLSPSEAASFDKTLARSPRRIESGERCPGFVTRDDGTKVYCGSGKGHPGACCCVELRDAVKSPEPSYGIGCATCGRKYVGGKPACDCRAGKSRGGQ